jgi:hypothetical protein
MFTDNRSGGNVGSYMLINNLSSSHIRSNVLTDNLRSSRVRSNMLTDYPHRLDNPVYLDRIVIKDRAQRASAGKTAIIQLLDAKSSRFDGFDWSIVL